MVADEKEEKVKLEPEHLYALMECPLCKGVMRLDLGIFVEKVEK